MFVCEYDSQKENGNRGCFGERNTVRLRFRFAKPQPVKTTQNENILEQTGSVVTNGMSDKNEVS